MCDRMKLHGVNNMKFTLRYYVHWWAVFSSLLHWWAVGCVQFVTTLVGCGLCSVCYYIGGLWAVLSLLLH
jgi:hypothetical protein